MSLKNKIIYSSIFISVLLVALSLSGSLSIIGSSRWGAVALDSSVDNDYVNIKVNLLGNDDDGTAFLGVLYLNDNPEKFFLVSTGQYENKELNYKFPISDFNQGTNTATIKFFKSNEHGSSVVGYCRQQLNGGGRTKITMIKPYYDIFANKIGIENIINDNDYCPTIQKFNDELLVEMSIEELDNARPVFINVMRGEPIDKSMKDYIFENIDKADEISTTFYISIQTTNDDTASEQTNTSSNNDMQGTTGSAIKIFNNVGLIPILIIIVSIIIVLVLTFIPFGGKKK